MNFSTDTQMKMIEDPSGRRVQRRETSRPIIRNWLLVIYILFGVGAMLVYPCSTFIRRHRSQPLPATQPTTTKIAS
jgi:hypothetical protein